MINTQIYKKTCKIKLHSWKRKHRYWRVAMVKVMTAGRNLQSPPIKKSVSQAKVSLLIL